MNHNSADPIAKRIAAYTPTTLSAQRWKQLRKVVCELVQSTPPHNTEDAKSLLVATCNYLAWLDKNTSTTTTDMADALTETRIIAYTAELATSAAKKTVKNQLGRLRRLHRNAHNIPTPNTSTANTTTHTAQRCTPYSPEELNTLLSLTNPEITTTVTLALTTGTVIPTAHTHPNGYPRSVWDTARRAARTAGIQLDSRRLHATWAHQQSQLPTPAAQLIRQGLSTTDLNTISRTVHPLPVEQLKLAR